MRIAIIGAGLSGATAAYILKNFNKKNKIDVYEKRDEIGGNCADAFTKFGYVQKYGPHIFHTNEKYIWNFLNLFSEFKYYQHKVFVYTEGNFHTFPLSFTFINKYDKTIFNRINTTRTFKNAQDYLYYILGKELTDKFFTHYSEKHWGIKFTELPVAVVKRIPIRENNDTRYFTDSFQGIPISGYSKIIKKIFKLTKSNVIINNNANFNLQTKYDLIINTGEIDSFFNYRFGKLEYRSILFKIQNNLDSQEAAVINYPNDYSFTRITDYNHFLTSTNFGLEYSVNENTLNSIKCYPLFWKKENILKYQKYQKFAKKQNIILLGRMGTYQYLNMDSAISQVFNTLKKFDSVRLSESLENDFIF